MLRRILLGAITALVVARPLVLGEDPGLLLRPWSDAWGLVLTLLWFVTALGGAVWLVWSGQRTGIGGIIEWGFLAVVGLVFASAAWSAAYQRPAWLIAWEWLALFLAFWLVRLLVRTPAENQRLLAALVASAVSLSVYAIYQYTVEFPQQRQLLNSNDELREALARQHIQFDVDEAHLQTYQKRIAFDHVFATFSHPNSFAGYLALLLPAGAGWAIAGWRRDRRSWLAGLAAFGAMCLAAALWLTHSRGALLGALLSVVAFGAVCGRHWLWARKGWVLGGVAVVAVGLVLFTLRASAGAGVDKSRRSFGLRLDYWSATWHMIGDGQHPRFLWLGVGPGNFSRYYPRYMLPTAWEEIKDPHNFVLEMWATSGLFAMLALLVALGAFFRAVWPAVRDPSAAAEPEEPAPRPAVEFYLGGMIGLILGFVLWALGRTGENPSDEILLGGLVAAVRSMVWFAAFAVLERIPWSGRWRAAALAVGVAALLVNLSVSGGIAFPSVALPLWVVAALALNALPRRSEGRQPGYAFGSVVPLPLLILVCLIYYSSVFVPVTECTGSLLEARKHYQEVSRSLTGSDRTKTDAAKQRDAMNAARYGQTHILPPLEKAAKADPDDVLPQVELAHWLGQLGLTREKREQALQHASKAIQLDPEGTAGLQERCQLYSALSGQAPNYRRLAIEDMYQLVKRSPTHAGLRYQLADLLFQADRKVEAREQAAEALKLDEHTSEPTRKLQDKQLSQIRQWLGYPAAGNSL